MAAMPPITKKRYDYHLPGAYGEFGAGAGVTAFYLQSTITPQQLDWVALISDIRGSERWPVRDLFQRDVDNKRITNALLPYLQATERIKFFNPLTLTVLPMCENGDSVLTQMPRVVQTSTVENDRTWESLERESYYRIKWVSGNPEYAVLEWSSTRSRLVAIDGQHRLSALKRFQRDPEKRGHDDFMKWRIPVVIVSFRAGEDRKEPPSVLEVVRSIFVYINKEAHRISRSREILLSDESINAVCVQELLQHSHTNDLKPEKERDERRLPLLFYDWRSEERDMQVVQAPAAVKDVEEVHAWFEFYILGEDFSSAQKDGLHIDPPDHQLFSVFQEQNLDFAASHVVRRRVNEQLLPAVSHLLENFTPYQTYVGKLRELERECVEKRQSDLPWHALHELRFGTNHAGDAIREAVQEVLDEIRNQIGKLRTECFHEPLDREIGMRGVMSGFGGLVGCFGYPDWTDYAMRFTSALNRIYEDGWLDTRSRARRRHHLLHVVYDHHDDVVNYRLTHADNALGAFVALLTAAYGRTGASDLRWPEEWLSDHEWVMLRDDLIDKLREVVLRGYKKQVKPQLKEEYPDGGKPLTEAVKREAEKLAGNQIRRLERELEKIG